VNSAFNLPFTEAASFFRQKLNIPTAKWDDLWKEEHAKAFMSAGAIKADLLTDLHDEVNKAISGDVTREAFLGRFDEIVAKHGWSYNGERRWRSNLIYDTNMSTSYQAGRWQQFQDMAADGKPVMLTYVHPAGVIHPRPEHVALNGTTLPQNDPFWNSHYPPNGWRCHCRAVYAGETPQQQPPKGWNRIDPKTDAPVGIDKGWDYNVGQAGLKQHEEVLANKLASLPPKISGDLSDMLASIKRGI
jgi:uncharacterized protein with gpF-like domain